MNSIEITLTAEQQRNLMVFLNRVPVTGINEASALVDIARTVGAGSPPRPQE